MDMEMFGNYPHIKKIDVPEDFEKTVSLVNEVKFASSYSFVYSPRPGTPASIRKLNNISDNKINPCIKIIQPLL